MGCGSRVLLKVDERLCFWLLHANSFKLRLQGWRAKGLNAGVWLQPCRSIQTFTVKQNIDVLWLDKEQKLIRIDLNVKPNKVRTCMVADSVIELPSGALKHLADSIELIT